jgi:hypothetical protein
MRDCMRLAWCTTDPAIYSQTRRGSCRTATQLLFCLCCRRKLGKQQMPAECTEYVRRYIPPPLAANFTVNRRHIHISCRATSLCSRNEQICGTDAAEGGNEKLSAFVGCQFDCRLQPPPPPPQFVSQSVSLSVGRSLLHSFLQTNPINSFGQPPCGGVERLFISHMLSHDSRQYCGFALTNRRLICHSLCSLYR